LNESVPIAAPAPVPDGLTIDEIDTWLRGQAKAAEEAGNSKLIEQYKWQCERIIGFTEYRFPRYRPSRHHRMIADQLERVERGEIDRLMIRVPPRHGKSELAAKSFPAYCIGRKPWRQFILGSASADLARDFGRDVRNIIASEAYQMVYPTRLAALHTR
jgi:hypothetical protein